MLVNGKSCLIPLMTFLKVNDARDATHFSWSFCLCCKIKLFALMLLYEPRCEKRGLRVSDRVPHKPGCAATEDG